MASLGADSSPPGRPHAKLSGHGNPGGTTHLHAAPANRATWCDGASGGNGPPALLRPGADVAPRPDRPRRGNLQWSGPVPGTCSGVAGEGTGGEGSAFRRRTEEIAQPSEQPLVSSCRHAPDAPFDPGAWKDCQVAQPNQRCRLETAPSEIRVKRANGLVELWHRLLELSADTADQDILERRHPLQEEDRAILDAAVSLRQRGEKDVAFPHGITSAVEYSGSEFP